MADRFSRVAQFILGPSAKANDDDDFEAEDYGDDSWPRYADTDDEPTDIVDVESVAISQKPKLVPAPVTSLEQRRRGYRSIPIDQIVHARPKDFTEAAQIGAIFKEGVPIILNLSTTDHKHAQKLVDFASGMAYVTGGNLERITPRVFLLCPQSVSFSDAEMNQLSEIHNIGE